jgi:SAM-dependent methyltransferase
VSSYDAIAELYDPWSRTVTEDVEFYVAEARKARSTMVELGVGTGRIAIPVALAGVPVIGVDSSAGMLGVCRRRAEAAGVEHLLDLRLGDLRDPPVAERVRLVTSPFRALLHLETDTERRQTLAAVHGLLEPGGRFVFDVFAPSAEDIEETHDRWLEREPGIWERARWDLEGRVLTLDVRSRESKASMRLSWLPADGWRDLLEEAGFEIVACYGWFDLRPYAGGEDSIWLARVPESPGPLRPRPGV